MQKEENQNSSLLEEEMNPQFQKEEIISFRLGGNRTIKIPLDYFLKLSPLRIH